MMMKTAPAAPLEVSEAKLLLEILIITLDAPTHFCDVNEVLHSRPSGNVESQYLLVRFRHRAIR